MLAALFLCALALLVALAFLSLRGQNAAASAEDVRLVRAVAPETGGDEALEAPAGKPEAVRGVYVSGSVAGSEDYEAYLRLAEETEINALVVDVKEAGMLTYRSDVALAQEIGATSGQIPDLAKLVERTESCGVYTIARLAAFQDDILARKRPEMAVKSNVTGEPWLNFNGATWTNAYNKDVWEYNVAIAKEAAEAGFDEVQFDYVRFPSDGPMEELEYGEPTFPSQEDAIAGFLKYARSELEPMGVLVAADVFGLVGHTDNGGIGQRVGMMAPHLDVLCPMIYPSHYTPGSFGYPNPNAEPYGTIKTALEDFREKARKTNPDLEIRPWLQDFDMGVPPYGPAEVEAQVQATYDAGYPGWLLWNAGSEFTTEALRGSSEIGSSE